jgi:hypothetical protein
MDLWTSISSCQTAWREGVWRNVQHYHTNSKRRFGLHAIRSDVLILHNVAVLGNVPRCALVYARWIDGVGRSLDVYAVGPEGEEASVQDQGEEWDEDFKEPHCGFDEVEEHAKYADYEVVLCVAGGC